MNRPYGCLDEKIVEQTFAFARKGAIDHHQSSVTGRSFRRNSLSVLPNKISLLQAALRRHLNEVAEPSSRSAENRKGRASRRCNKAIAEMLAGSCDPLEKDAQLMASILQGTMAGVGRGLLESDVPDSHFASVREELILSVCSYLRTSAARFQDDSLVTAEYRADAPLSRRIRFAV